MECLSLKRIWYPNDQTTTYEELNTITCPLWCRYVRLCPAGQGLWLLPLLLSLLLLLQPGNWWLLLLVQMVVWLLKAGRACRGAGRARTSGSSVEPLRPSRGTWRGRRIGDWAEGRISHMGHMGHMGRIGRKAHRDAQRLGRSGSTELAEVLALPPYSALCAEYPFG